MVFSFLLLVIFMLSFLFIVQLEHLISSLITLEILGFCCLASLVIWFSALSSLYFIFIFFMVVFVIEAVLGLLGLVLLLSSVGSDYINLSSLILS